MLAGAAKMRYSSNPVDAPIKWKAPGMRMPYLKVRGNIIAALTLRVGFGIISCLLTASNQKDYTDSTSNPPDPIQNRQNL